MLLSISDGLSLDFHDQVVFLGIFLKLVADRAHDTFNLVREELLERVDGDGALLVVDLLKLLLVVQDGDHMGIVLPVLLRALSIVQINQHVRQVLVQSILNVLRVLLSLTPLLLLWVVTLSVLLVVLLALLLRVTALSIRVVWLLTISLSSIGAAVELRIGILLIRLIALARVGTLGRSELSTNWVLRVPLLLILNLVT